MPHFGQLSAVPACAVCNASTFTGHPYRPRSLIDQLQRIDKRREALHHYMTRLRRLFFVPELRDRMLARTQKRWRDLSQTRDELYALINASPELKAELQQRQRAALNEPTAAEQIAAQRKVSTPTTASLANDASELLALIDQERQAKNAYQDCVWYYKQGNWQADQIFVEDVTAQMEYFKRQMQDLCMKRAEYQVIFEDNVRNTMNGDPQHIHYREQLMASAKFKAAKDAAPRPDGAPPPNDFQKWLTQHRRDPDTPTRSRGR